MVALVAKVFNKRSLRLLTKSAAGAVSVVKG